VNEQRRVELINGQTGSGKTTEAKTRCSRLSRVLVLEAGFDEFPVAHSPTAESLLLSLEQRDAFPKNSRPSLVPFAVGFSPLEREYDWCFELARELGNLSIIMDEGDRFDPRESEAYDEIITRGRHWNVSLVVVGLHTYSLPKNLRRQATRITAFRQVDPTDLDALAEIVGPHAYRIGPDARGLFNLPDFSRLDWTAKSGARILGPSGQEIKPLTTPRPSVTIPIVPPEPVADGPGGSSLTGSEGDTKSQDLGENNPCPKQSASSSASE